MGEMVTNEQASLLLDGISERLAQEMYTLGAAAIDDDWPGMIGQLIIECHAATPLRDLALGVVPGTRRRRVTWTTASGWRRQICCETWCAGLLWVRVQLQLLAGDEGGSH